MGRNKLKTEDEETVEKIGSSPMILQELVCNCDISSWPQYHQFKRGRYS